MHRLCLSSVVHIDCIKIDVASVLLLRQHHISITDPNVCMGMHQCMAVCGKEWTPMCLYSMFLGVNFVH